MMFFVNNYVSATCLARAIKYARTVWISRAYLLQSRRAARHDLADVFVDGIGCERKVIRPAPPLLPFIRSLGQFSPSPQAQESCNVHFERSGTCGRGLEVSRLGMEEKAVIISTLFGRVYYSKVQDSQDDVCQACCESYISSLQPRNQGTRALGIYAL